MGGVVQFIRSLVFVAFVLGSAGTLVEATGCVGRDAVKGPISMEALFFSG